MTTRRATKRSGTRAARSSRVRRRRTAAAPKGKPSPVSASSVLYRVCKPGWAVVAEKQPSAPDTRFVCPFCPRSHRVPGPVRGFRRVRRPQWLKLRRVFE